MNVAILAPIGPGVGMLVGRDMGDFVESIRDPKTSRLMAALRVAVVLILLMLGQALMGAPSASAGCSSAEKTQYIQLLTSRGQQAVGLEDGEIRYLQMLAESGVTPASAHQSACDLVRPAYSILLATASSSASQDQIANAMSKKSGLSVAAANQVIMYVFNSFGFPPTCDMCNDPWHGSPFPPPGHN